MGTLTGHIPSLPEHCPHKLPTSCRLTASPKCCACQDVRPHNPLYTTYVDGVGLVARGTRWQRYCYFCKIFWENRVAATVPPMQPRDSRIPEVPDQKLFLDKWFEYHRGYRIVGSDGDHQEVREEVACEKPWRDTDPGTLPVLNRAERRMVLRGRHDHTHANTTQTVSLDDTLNALLDAAGEESGDRPVQAAQMASSSRHSEASHVHQGDQSASRDRLLSGLQIETHHNPGPDPDTVALEESLARLRGAEARYRSAQLRRQRATCELTAAETELNTRQAQKVQAQQEHQQIQARQEQRPARLHGRMEEISHRTAQRLARVFGTREEIERQGADYVSPLTSMFTRAYERYRVAEEVRAEERASTQNSERHREFLATMAAQQYPQLYHAIQERVEREIAAEEPQKTLDDEEDQRPPPKTEQQMTVKLVCKVCLQQTADTAVLPCGHLVMCSYCADICVPARPNDLTQPLGKSQCPLCRKQVKRRARIFTS